MDPAVPKVPVFAQGGQQSGLEGSSGQHRSTDAPQVPTLPTVSTLAQDAAEQQPMDTQPQAPRTVAELISVRFYCLLLSVPTALACFNDTLLPLACKAWFFLLK